MTAQLSGQLRTAVQLLRWCAESKAAATHANGCAHLQHAATQAVLYLARASAKGQADPAHLRAALAELHRQTAAISPLAEAAPGPAPGAQLQAALIRSVRQLPAGFARHTVPSVIAAHSSASASVLVERLPADQARLLGGLSVRLTVMSGDAVRIVRPPKTDGPYRWVCTIAGVHPGKADVLTELFVDAPPGSGLAPVHYDSWVDHITVQPSMLTDVESAARGIGVWLLLGGAAAGVVLTGLWMRRRQAHELLP
jgi:hypothetical protein